MVALLDVVFVIKDERCLLCFDLSKHSPLQVWFIVLYNGLDM